MTDYTPEAILKDVATVRNNGFAALDSAYPIARLLSLAERVAKAPTIPMHLSVHERAIWLDPEDHAKLDALDWDEQTVALVNLEQP